MRFLADGMLGKLTRWMRLIGCDVEYLNDVSDDRLIERAVAEGRVLLTRDVVLLRQAVARGAEAFLVEGKTQAEKLANTAKRFGIKLEVDTAISRCPTCNSLIIPVEKEEVKGKLPPTTLRVYEEFWLCSGCGKVYWRGGHWKKIGEILSEAQRILKSKSHSKP